MSATDTAIAQIRSALTDRDRRMPQRQPNDLERALNNYREMEADRDRLRESHADLLVSNRSLQAEVNMLRESLERSDNDRIRLQAIASTFVGGIRSLNAVCTDLYSLAIKNGVEAAEAAQPEAKAELDAAGAEVRDIIERTTPAAGGNMPPNQFG